MRFLDEQQIEYITKLNYIASIKVVRALLIIRVLRNTASKGIKYIIYITTIVIALPICYSNINLLLLYKEKSPNFTF